MTQVADATGTSDSRRERWARATEWPLTIASLIFLAAYSWEVIADLSGTAEVVTETIINVTWATFAVDYVVNLVLARPRAAWFRGHLLDLAIVALPILRPLRLLRLVTVLQQLNRHTGRMIRRRVVIYTVAATVLLIYVAGLAVLEAERRVGEIATFGDALWWAFVTVTTVGYGDFAPVTPTGRLIAVALMIGGIALIGVVTATLASWIVERISDDDRAERVATERHVAELHDQLLAIRALLESSTERPAPPTERTPATWPRGALDPEP